MQLIAPKILGLAQVWGSPQERGEVPHDADIVVLGLGAELADGHVLDHALTQRTDRWGRHETLLSEEGDEPDHLQTGRAGRDLHRWINDAGAARPCRGSGLVPWREADITQRVLQLGDNDLRPEQAGRSGAHPNARALAPWALRPC